MADKNELLEPIAIIGMGGIFPGSTDISGYWQNIVNKVDSIIEVPKDRWDWKLYYDANPAAPDKTYSKIGGFILDFKFDPLKLRIPPPVANQMDMVQKLAVAATAEALHDSGYDTKSFDPERTAVILGNSMGGTKKEATDMRVYSAYYENRLSLTPAFCKLAASSQHQILAEMKESIKSNLSTITEDTMPGELSNVIAGRVANTFNFNGANFTVDAACASSLAALDQAANGLRSHEYDMVICGGVDQMMSPPAYVKFCKIGALSPDGSRPFDAGANGFVMGEGAGVCVLKRLSDALRDGDRIYALVRAIGSSSDGRGKGITAPNPRGQRLAVERTFAQLDYTPGDIGLLEAHGTSTKVGDVVEVNTTSEILKAYAPKHSIGLGSVKSQIGHLKAAAGIAGLIKAALAIHHKTLPPSINFHTPNPGVDWENSPLFVVTESKEWAGGKPRRANISSFGFGGTNFHVALEESAPATTARWTAAAAASRARPHSQTSASTAVPNVIFGAANVEANAAEIPGPAITNAGAAGIALPPSAFNVNPAVIGEVFLIHGATPDAVLDRLSSLAARIPADDASLFSFANEINSHFERQEYSLCFTAESAAKLREKADFILKHRSPELWSKTPPAFKPKGIYFGQRKKPGKIGMLFPGQGSQYVDMLKDLREKYSIVAETFAEADAVMQEVAGYNMSEVLFTKGGETPEQIEAMENKLKQTEITQPAVLTADIAMLRLLELHGIRPDIICGHSLGEYGALVASGIFNFKDALLAVSVRGKEMAGVKVPDHGKMASVAAPMEKIEPILKEIKGYVAPANKNCPAQTVIAGESRAVEAAVKKFMALGIQAQEIRVSHAFHSKIVAPGQAPYRRFLERMPLSSPKIPILSNVTAAYYPDDLGEIRELLVAQIASPVEFIRQVERMYKDGVRLFVEAGPKRVLTAFVTSTLENKKDAVAVSSNHPKRGGILEFNDLLARLVAEGVDIRLPASSSLSSETRSALRPPLASRPAASVSGAPTRSASEMTMPAADEYQTMERWGFYTGPVAVSGIAAGTPGAWDRVFRKDNIDQIIRGQNLIGKLSEQDIQRQIDKNIVRLIKSATGDHRLERIQNAAEVVQLAALAGEFDLAKEFGFKESIASAMDVSSKLSVAAGILALQDAGIALVPTYKETTTGSNLHTGWALPASMRDETGIIFATAYPSIDSMASEVSRYLSDKYRRKPLRELAALLESLISQLKDPDDRAAVESWYASSFRSYQERYGNQGPYEFTREFLLKVMPLGHAQLAQWIGARGPAVQMSAACASTTQAVAMAEDWIRLGRAKRVIVIAGDDVTSPHLREWMVTGFLTVGAATTVGVVSEAALPFDRRRNGMILGMGAAALIIEQGSKTSERGMRPLTEILSTQFENSAFHATRLDVDHVSRVMERLISKAETRWGIDRKQIASKALFMSHETYTPARGGSASAEVLALKRTFGSEAARIVITNTKGFTGHSMGASIEEPTAIRALIAGEVPPIANYREPDPELEGVTLSRGGSYDLDYAIRLGAGFGSQIAMTLMKRVLKKGESRISDPARHQQWLRDISGQANPELEVANNTLRVRSGRVAPRPATSKPLGVPQPAAHSPAETAASARPRSISLAQAPSTAHKSSTLMEQEVQSAIVQLVSEKTGYPPEMLEFDLDMEADLGIDTVKQAELIGIIREKYSIPRQENLTLKNYPTLRHVIGFVMESTGSTASTVVPPLPARTPSETLSEDGRPENVFGTPSAAPVSDVGEGEIKESVIALVSQKTGYPSEMLELDLDMEADLGIDTVKQAELFGIIREKYSIPRQENLALKDYPTLRHLIRFVQESSGDGARPQTPASSQISPAISPKVPVLTQAKSEAPRKDAFGRWVLKPYEKFLEPSAAAKDKYLRKAQSIAIVCSKSETAEPFIKAFKAFGITASVTSQVTDKTQGILHLGGLELEEFNSSMLKTFDPQYVRAVRSLFLTAKAGQNNLAADGHWLIAATRQSRHPLAGAISGLTKALRKELPGARVHSIDFDAKTSLKEAAQSLIAELQSNEEQAEIIYRGGKRYGLRLMPELSATASTLSLDNNSTVIITGGGQGLGAECAKAIAERYQSRLIILGRTSLDPKVKEWAKLDAEGLKKLKEQMWVKLKSDKSQKATPALLERAFAPIIKAATLQKNLEAFHSAGSQVTYLDVDLADVKKVQAAIKSACKFAKPDLILHAAGLEESKLLADKTSERFDAIFRAKAHGAVHLLEFVPKKPGQTWIFFSSVVGRFGNVGQTDYAAASDFLAKLADSLKAQSVRAVAVDLTAIADIGMATRGGVEQFLKSQGVDFMPPAVAVEMILTEAAHNSGATEVLLAGNLGGLDADKQMQAPTLPNRTLPQETTISKEFSLQSDPWLQDHSIAGTPYVAGVMGLELLAETADKLLGHMPVGFENVHFSLPIKLLRQKPITVRTIGNISYSNGKPRTQLHIESDFLTPQGIKLGGPRTHFTAQVTDNSATDWDQIRKPKNLAGTLPEKMQFAVEPETIYSAYFHGPSFQVLAGIISISEKEILAAYREPQKALWTDGKKNLVFHPMLIEAAFQTCGYRDLHFSKKMTLPDSIGRVLVWNHPVAKASPKTLYVLAAHKGSDKEGRSIYDAYVFDSNDRLWVALKDYKMIPVS